MHARSYLINITSSATFTVALCLDKFTMTKDNIWEFGVLRGISTGLEMKLRRKRDSFGDSLQRELDPCTADLHVVSK